MKSTILLTASKLYMILQVCLDLCFSILRFVYRQYGLCIYSRLPDKMGTWAWDKEAGDLIRCTLHFVCICAPLGMWMWGREINRTFCDHNVEVIVLTMHSVKSPNVRLHVLEDGAPFKRNKSLHLSHLFLQAVGLIEPHLREHVCKDSKIRIHSRRLEGRVNCSGSPSDRKQSDD